MNVEKTINVEKTQTIVESSVKFNQNLRPLSVALKEATDRPPMKHIWFGIPENPCVILVSSLPKIGKSCWMETFAYHLASTESNDFMGFPVSNGKRVAIISLEEFEPNRSARQLKQVQNLPFSDIERIMENIYVLDSNFHQYIACNQHKKDLIDNLLEVKPDIVFIDSLSRMYVGAIEQSEVAQNLMGFTNEIAAKLQAPIVILHHLNKSKSTDEIDARNVSGSRIVNQDASGMLVMGKTPSNQRYLKVLNWRYYPDDDHSLRLFSIDENCLIHYEGIPPESTSGTTYPVSVKVGNPEKILDFLLAQKGIVLIEQLIKAFVDTGLMSRSTLFLSLRTLLESGNITKNASGEYFARRTVDNSLFSFKASEDFDDDFEDYLFYN